MLIKMARQGTDFIEKIETGLLDVEISEAYIGPLFISNDGEQLGICQRDSGFELTYIVDGMEQVISLNNGGFVAYPKRKVE